MWFVVRTNNKRRAREIGVLEYGRGNLKDVREATKAEVECFVSQKGQDALRE